MKINFIDRKRIIKLGLIGAGQWGKNYIKTIEKSDDISLLAISSNNEKTKDIIPTYCHLFKDWREMIKLDDLDGIIVSSPTFSHYEICKELLNINIPILAEKPLSTKIKEVEKLLKICDEKKSILMVNYIHLYHMRFQEILNINKKGSSKKIINIESESGNYGPFRRDTRALWDWGVHDVAMMLVLIKEYPVQISSKFLKKLDDEYRCGELIEAKFNFSSGSKAKLIFGNLQERKIKKFIAKTNSKTYVYNPFDKKILNNPIKNIQPLEICIKEFRRKILQKDTSLEDMELSLSITKIINKIENQLEHNI